MCSTTSNQPAPRKGGNFNEESMYENNEDGWKEHAEWHYRKRSTVMKHMGFILGVITGVLLAAAWLWIMTIMMFVM